LRWGAITIAAIAGLLIGFAATNFAYRNRILRAPGGHGFVDRLADDVQLTPDQRRQVQDLVRDSRAKMEQLHQDFHRQHHDLIMHTHDQIRTLLTPEQQQKFDRDFSHPGEHHEHHHDDD
jgi:Spy/CpxP family protein refolding chaperone